MAKATPIRRDHHLRLVEYPLAGGWKALVGRTDADNDYLSLTVAQPDDWWFHVRGVPGGHVILQGPPGEEPDRETLNRAAAIAASIAASWISGWTGIELGSGLGPALTET